MSAAYFMPKGGLPAQTELMTGRAIFTTAYAFLPRGVMRDIVTSFLPHWTGMRMWMIARPMTGFSETFSQYIVELQPGGGSRQPEVDARAQSALFVTSGSLTLTIAGQTHHLRDGSFAYIPAGSDWQIVNSGATLAGFHWIRKRYQRVVGLPAPEAFVVNERDLPINWMPGTNQRWGTTRFVDPADLRHDMHVTIVTFEPGGVIPFEETHVMEHGLYVLEGKAVYKLNTDWIEVEAGDFMWLRAYCPQACYAGGPGRFRYLLYKDVNRHAELGGMLGG